MSSDDFEGEIDFDSAFLEGVDDIAATHFSTTLDQSHPAGIAQSFHDTLSLSDLRSRPSTIASQSSKFRPAKLTSTLSQTRDTLSSSTSTSDSQTDTRVPSAAIRSKSPECITLDDSDDDMFEDIGPEDFEMIDAQFNQLRSSTNWKTPSATKQTTLDGRIAENAVAGPSRLPSSTARPFGKKAAKTKTWDRTAFAETGYKPKPGTGKGKKRGWGNDDMDEEHEAEEVEFQQFPAPFVPLGLNNFCSMGAFSSPIPTMKLQVDKDAAREWIFPINRPKRDYQFNIVRNCLFENSLVALPTGLGKTFIAGVIMMNYFRWFPKGKIVFVAPTKPLVGQQIEACRETCGIPPVDSAEMTGKIPRATRWRNKRVFYMTPQTLFNDITEDACDPLDIVLLVVDEAHRATGNYAYSTVVRYLTAKNPHFRLLALTATPGADAEAVQMVCDNLHISHIEIRDETALDLREYVHEKKLVQTIVPMEGDIMVIKDLLAKVMEKEAKKLRDAGVVNIFDVVKLHPFRCQMVGQSKEMHAKPWLRGTSATLGVLARAMGYLLEQSMSMCHRTLVDYKNGKELEKEVNESFGSKKQPPKKKAPQKKLADDPDFKQLMGEMESIKTAHGGRFPSHPKLDKLLAVLLDHFSGPESATADGGGGSTRVMVFTQFRDCVDEIVDILNGHGPILRATRFVGQATDKSGNKGIAQKDQMEVIKQFKEDKHNILVATSIGEEGLDIGEVDLIVCYDSQKTPIRMLQRIGRTGRKRSGRIEVLSAAGREEENFDKAQAAYREVQKSIIRGEQLELFGDVPRLIPDEIRPECVMKVVEIPAAAPVEVKSKSNKGKRKAGDDDDDDEDDGGRAKKSAPKKKRKVGMDVPTGAADGFVSVKDLIIKSKAAKKKAETISMWDVEPHEDDSDDLALESGLAGISKKAIKPPPPPRTTMTKKCKKAKSSGTGSTTARDLAIQAFQPSDNDDDANEATSSKALAKTSRSPPTKTKKSPKNVPPSEGGVFVKAADLELRGLTSSSDDDDKITVVMPKRTSRTPPKKKTRRAPSPIELLSSPEGSPRVGRRQTHMEDVSGVRVAARTQPKSLLDDLTRSSSPPAPAASTSTSSSRSSSRPTASNPNRDVHSWLLDGSDDLPVEPPVRMKNPSAETEVDEFDMQMDDGFDEWLPTPAPDAMKERARLEWEAVERKQEERQSKMPGTPPTAVDASSSLRRSTEDPDMSFEVAAPGRRKRGEMLPPAALPRHVSSPVIDLSYPVRAPGAPRRLRRGPAIEDEAEGPSHDVETTPVSPEVAATSSTRRPKKAKKQKALLSRIGNAMFAMEAEHSGDEESAGGSDYSDENEYDRSFVADGDATQAPKGYDQEAIYRRGLMTQAPGTCGPAFRSRPVRNGQYKGGAAGVRRWGGAVSSSPKRDDEEPDEYEMGSFVVEDDDGILDLPSSEK